MSQQIVIRYLLKATCSYDNTLVGCSLYNITLSLHLDFVTLIILI